MSNGAMRVPRQQRRHSVRTGSREADQLAAVVARVRISAEQPVSVDAPLLVSADPPLLAPPGQHPVTAAFCPRQRRRTVRKGSQEADNLAVAVRVSTRAAAEQPKSIADLPTPSSLNPLAPSSQGPTADMDAVLTPAAPATISVWCVCRRANRISRPRDSRE